jgi:hypothetical protein
MYPGKVLEDIGSSMLAFGGLGILGTLFATLEIGVFTGVFLVFAGVTVTLCLLGYILLVIGERRHLQWCKDMGYIK